MTYSGLTTCQGQARSQLRYPVQLLVAAPSHSHLTAIHEKSWNNSVWFLVLLKTLPSVILLFSTIYLLSPHNKSPSKLSGLKHQHYMIIMYGFCGLKIWESFGCAQSLSCSWTQTMAGAGQAPLSLVVPRPLPGLSRRFHLASSGHGALRADGLLTWELNCLRASVSRKQKLHHLWWYFFRASLPAASLLPHSIGYQWVTSPPRFKGRVISLDGE